MRALVLMLAVLAMAAAPLAAQTSSSGKSPARTGRSSAKALPSAPINLNTATAAQLAELPGIGPKAAQRIVEYRQKNGSFKKIEELMNVKGIGEKSFLKLKPAITVGTDRAAAAQK
jgi:competence protein ComEA